MSALTSVTLLPLPADLHPKKVGAGETALQAMLCFARTSLLAMLMCSWAIAAEPLRIALEIHGWTKGFASGAGATSASALLLVIAWMTGLMIAPLMAALTGDWPLWGTACLLCSLQVVWLGRKLGSFGWPMLFFYPVPLMFFFGTFGWSAMRSGKKVTWKGRDIDAD